MEGDRRIKLGSDSKKRKPSIIQAKGSGKAEQETGRQEGNIAIGASLTDWTGKRDCPEDVLGAPITVREIKASTASVVEDGIQTSQSSIDGMRR